jgi:mono/diheme cytochrome c family protein
MKIFKIVGIVLVILIVLGLGVYAWASSVASRKLSRIRPTHAVDFPIPFPLDEEVIRRDRLTPEAAESLALSKALERGKHLVQSRYGCVGCHGENFGGGVMIDDPAMGRILGPNLTPGKGSATAGFRAANWDRIVRHAVKPDGKPALMPSQDFQRMSDQELSDIIVFIRSQPPIDRQVPEPALGPVGKLLVATGKFTLFADLIEADDAPHPKTPPEAAPTVAFGRHVAATCMGCHRPDLGGGPIIGGDPSWPPAANLTPGPGGLGGWTFAQFTTALREGKRPDGTALRPPMSELAPFARKMTEVELQALWNYLRSIPAVAARD